MISIEEKKIWRVLLHAMHDLRTSLHSVGGFVYLIKEDGRQPSLSELPTLEENLKYFNPPTDADNRKVSTSTEIYYCQLLVRLLGGFIYIDPDYKNGRRVIFSIAI